jgi:hypothetical protein
MVHMEYVPSNNLNQEFVNIDKIQSETDSNVFCAEGVQFRYWNTYFPED